MRISDWSSDVCSSDLIGRSVSANSNADTDAEADAVLGYPIFMLGHGGHDCLPEPKCGLSVAGGQHYEFVSPYASDHIKGANHASHIISDCFQQIISGVMSQSVIYALEAIHIHILHFSFLLLPFLFIP